MKLVLFLLLWLTCHSAAAIHVVFVNPSIPGTPFWDRVTSAAKAAGDDLGLKLEIIYGRDNRIFNLEAIQTLIARKNKPDYVIFMPYDGNSETTFSSLNNAEIPFVTIERTLQQSEQKQVGFPREKYEYWIGEVFHDNNFAGQLLADTLIHAAKEDNPEKEILAIGISGSFSGESTDRTLGLEKSIKNQENVTLAQVVPAIWSRERSRNIIHQLTSRFGQVDVAWTASDGMALGVLDSVKSGHGNINTNMKIGGIDWTVEAIDRVRAGELTASVGGHFMQTAWALVKIHDHHKGIKVFTGGDMGKTYDLEVIDKSNIRLFGILSKKIDWEKVDFKRYSLIFNGQDAYEFSLEKMIRKLH